MEEGTFQFAELPPSPVDAWEEMLVTAVASELLVPYRPLVRSHRSSPAPSFRPVAGQTSGPIRASEPWDLRQDFTHGLDQSIRKYINTKLFFQPHCELREVERVKAKISTQMHCFRKELDRGLLFVRADEIDDVQQVFGLHGGGFGFQPVQCRSIRRAHAGHAMPGPASVAGRWAPVWPLQSAGQRHVRQKSGEGLDQIRVVLGHQFLDALFKLVALRAVDL